MEILTTVGPFLRDFGLPLGIMIVFSLMLISKPRGSQNPYLVTGSAIEAKEREMAELRVQHAADKAEWQKRYDEDHVEWQQLRAEEKSQRMQADARLTESLKLMTDQTAVIQEMRIELARVAARMDGQK